MPTEDSDDLASEDGSSARIGRRSFIAGGIATASLGGLVPWACADAAITDSKGRTGSDPWEILARSISGPVLRPGDPGFEELALPFNLREAYVTPAGIARCRTARDVSKAIRWARRYRYPLVARSGGHSAADYSVTTGLMIDTKLMDSATFDSRTGIVTIGGGVLNSGVYEALEENNVTITHGRCPQVGAAGFLLGGGIGFNIRRLGVGIDALVASEIVTASGDILPLSQRRNPGLFWACRGGGGGNFGINTSFSLRTFPVPASVTASRLIWKTDADRVFPALMASLDRSPASLGSWTTLSAVKPQDLAKGDDVPLIFEGQLYGTPAQLDRILSPVYRIEKPSESEIEEMSYWDAQRFFSDTPDPSEFQNRGLYFRGPIPRAALEKMIYWLRRWPGTSKYANISFLQTGGQANAVPARATAFVHRDNDWYMVWYLKWKREDSRSLVRANLAWLNAFYNAIAPYAIGQAYQNFMDPSLTDFLHQYYAVNLRRLERVKAAVDPHRVFNFPQAIPPAR
ncbi:MAG TPA: FAD-binding oxidoreductase [Streptosporangiaceae bacterium]|nr:FAD-binding oxidoreductase [Streptosporangiaceae bacterium]